MKFFRKAKDGGPESNVTGYWLIEWKRLFSIVLLRFGNGTRDAYHSHAFNACSWLLKGRLIEYTLGQSVPDFYEANWVRPIYTPRERFHRVYSDGVSWVLSFRGPWSKEWREYKPADNMFIVLSDGRKVVSESSGN